MDSEELHYPPGAEPEQKPADTPPAPEKEEEAPAPEPEGHKPEETKSEEEGKQPDKGTEPPPEPSKKRSIYDNYKEKKQEAKEAVARAEAEARASELQALLDKKDDAVTPEERKEAKDDLEAFAEKEGLKPDALKDLIGIIQKRLPQPEGGVLTKEEADEWRAERTRAKAAEEDRAVLQEAPAVRKQLTEYGVLFHDELEFTALMNEVVKLSHTKAFHDKDVDYIVFKNRDALSKMISPKKASFEQGGQRGESTETDVSFDGWMTPSQASAAMHSSAPRSEYEIRRGS